jgi:peptidyl-prolyl cis-trans isomerase C
MIKNNTNKTVVLVLIFLMILPLVIFAGGKKEEKKETEIVVQDKNEVTEREAISDFTKDAAAMVNGIIIPLQNYNGQVQAIIQQYASQGANIQEAQIADLKNRVLENLIDQELLYQDANSQGLVADEAAVNLQFEAVKGQFPDEATFKSELATQGMTEEWIKADIAKAVLVDDYISSKYESEIKVDDAEVLKFYEENGQYFSKPEQLRASHILIKAEENADESVKKDALKRINEIKVRLDGGEEFSDLARELSEGPTNVKGGDLGAFGRGNMVESFENAAFSLNVGDVSDVVITKFGYHLIKLTAKEVGSTVPFDDVKVQIVDHLHQVKMAEKINQYISTIKPGATIERYVK